LAIASENEAGLTDRLLAGAFVAACVERGQRLLLHASPGRHRTRWAFVAYRIWSGVAPGAALRQAAQAPWLAPYATDEAAWERMAEAVRRRRREVRTALPLDAP
jgi:hypothetical protein